MKRGYKIILGGIVVIIITFVGKHLFDRHFLHQEYVKALEQKENEYIHSFYQSSFIGVINYIKIYEKDKYVIGVINSAKFKKTIGKVEITNFANVMEGDTVKKRSNSFELEIKGQKGKTISHVKYE